MACSCQWVCGPHPVLCPSRSVCQHIIVLIGIGNWFGHRICPIMVQSMPIMVQSMTDSLLLTGQPGRWPPSPQLMNR